MEKEIIVEAKELQPNQPAIRETTSCAEPNPQGFRANESSSQNSQVSHSTYSGEVKNPKARTIEEKQYLLGKVRLAVSAAILVVLLASAIIIVPNVVKVSNTVNEAGKVATTIAEEVDANMDDILNTINSADEALKSIDSLAQSAQTSMDTLNGILEDLSTTTSLLAKIVSIFK